MMILRNPAGVSEAIHALSRRDGRGRRAAETLDRQRRQSVLRDTCRPIASPGVLDAMTLLDQIALEGVRFPAALFMFRKDSLHAGRRSVRRGGTGSAHGLRDGPGVSDSLGGELRFLPRAARPERLRTSRGTRCACVARAIPACFAGPFCRNENLGDDNLI